MQLACFWRFLFLQLFPFVLPCCMLVARAVAWEIWTFTGLKFNKLVLLRFSNGIRTKFYWYWSSVIVCNSCTLWRYKPRPPLVRLFIIFRSLAIHVIILYISRCYPWNLKFQKLLQRPIAFEPPLKFLIHPITKLGTNGAFFHWLHRIHSALDIVLTIQ